MTKDVNDDGTVDWLDSLDVNWDEGDKVSEEWYDLNQKTIKEGDCLYNPFNQPSILEVLSDGEQLYLGDFETPFDDRYQFHHFWEIIGGVKDD